MSITDTVRSDSFTAHRRLPSGDTAAAWEPLPTVIVARRLLVAVLMTAIALFGVNDFDA